MAVFARLLGRGADKLPPVHVLVAIVAGPKFLNPQLGKAEDLGSLLPPQFGRKKPRNAAGESRPLDMAQIARHRRVGPFQRKRCFLVVFELIPCGQKTCLGMAIITRPNGATPVVGHFQLTEVRVVVT